MAFFALALAASGCGDDGRGDAEATSGTFKVKTVWSFPDNQPLGKPQKFRLVVRNVDTQDIPQLVITVRGLRQFIKQTGAASITRPVWVPDEVNYSDVTPNSTATASTFSLGALPAGEFKTYVLPMTPIRRGEHGIGYVLAGNLYGSAKVEFEDGSPAADEKKVVIDPTPTFDKRVQRAFEG